jgi:hypothetical protein
MNIHDLKLAESCLRQLEEDAAEMDRVNPDGRVHGYASRIKDCVGVLRVAINRPVFTFEHEQH